MSRRTASAPGRTSCRNRSTRRIEGSPPRGPSSLYELTPRWSAPPERPDLDRPRLRDRMARRDLHGLLEAAALDDVEPADGLLRLGERAVGHQRLAVADANGARLFWRSQPVARRPHAARPEIVQPRETFLFARVVRTRLGLVLLVHALRVPADQQQVFHVAPSFRWSVV